MQVRLHTNKKNWWNKQHRKLKSVYSIIYYYYDKGEKFDSYSGGLDFIASHSDS